MPQISSDIQLELSATLSYTATFLRLEDSFGVKNLSVENKSISGSIDSFSHMYLNVSSQVAFLLKLDLDGYTETKKRGGGLNVEKGSR